MMIRNARHIIKEGIVNLYRNKLMSLASVSTVVASLIIFGVFFILIFNLNINTKALKQQPHIRVVCNEYLEEFEIQEIGRAISENELVREVDFVSKKEAFEELKEMLGEQGDILEGMNEDFLSAAYIVELKNPEDSSGAADAFRELHGVEKVQYSQRAIDMVIGLSKWIQVVSVLMFIVLFIVTMFIISNTVKLTVYARRKEINIMKYIGATDWFIRWPFIVEGIAIGVTGAAAALILTGYAYRGLVTKVNTELMNIGSEIVRLATTDEIGTGLVVFYTSIGVLVGALGSAVSLRRHLRV